MKTILTAKEYELYISTIKNIGKEFIPSEYNLDDILDKDTFIMNDCGINASFDADGNYVVDTDERLLCTYLNVVNKHAKTVGAIVNICKSAWQLLKGFFEQISEDFYEDIEEVYAEIAKEKEAAAPVDETER